MELKELVEYIKVNVNLMDYATKHYGFEFRDNSGNLVPACCKLKSHGKSDDTPSFMYHRDTNSYNCHGCNKGGSLFNLVADQEDLTTRGLDFINIVKMICDNEGIKHDLDKQKPLDPIIEAEYDRRKTLATKYRNYLWANKDSRAFQYLLSRGFTEQTIANFYLGLTEPNETKFGIANMSNRISIPIFSSTGSRVPGISCRTLDDCDDCKYVNSHKLVNPDEKDVNKQKVIFNKGSMFYGWSHAIEHIRKNKHAYVVEGYFDMISMYQIGLKNTVAMMTNRMTEEQIAILSKYVTNITLIIDQDDAGIRGFNDTLITMLRYGLNVKIVTSLDYKGKDINDVCNKLKWDYNEVYNLIQTNSIDAVLFKLNKAFEKYDDKVMKLQNSVLSISSALTDNIADANRKNVLINYVEKRLGLR